MAAIVVSYGPSFRALACARSLLEGASEPDYVVIVNNGPTEFDSRSDGAQTADVERFDPAIGLAGRVTVVEAQQNLGYSGALRLGVATLANARSNIDYLWLLNNDVIVHRDALSALLVAADGDRAVGLWGCTICRDSTFSRVSAVGVRYSRWTTRRHAVLADMRVSEALERPTDPPFDFIPGSSMFIARDVYERCGGLSTAYFMYFEELDLAARVRALGLRIGWCRRALIAHDGGATTGSHRRRRSRPASVGYHSMRSAVIYAFRHDRAALPTVIVSRVLAHVCLNAALGDVRTARAAARGCVDGIRDGMRSETSR